MCVTFHSYYFFESSCLQVGIPIKKYKKDFSTFRTKSFRQEDGNYGTLAANPPTKGLTSNRRKMFLVF